MKNDMLISTALLIAAFIFAWYRLGKRKMKARELVLIAMLSAITAAANLMCAYTLPIHAGTAMVILTGIALGSETGFLTGCLARFVCNFFMSQGMWTPWEMFAWGLLGYLSGIVFSRTAVIGLLEDKAKIRREKQKSGIKAALPMAACFLLAELAAYVIYLLIGESTEAFFGWRLYVFGAVGIFAGCIFIRHSIPANFVTVPVYTFIVVFVIYGGIMNLGSLVMSNAVSGENFSLEGLKLMYYTGVPYDAGHALGAAVCTFLFGDSLIQKLKRLQIKYGMCDRKSTVLKGK